MKNITKPLILKERHLDCLIENRTVYTLDCCELNIFETFVTAEQVPLHFDDFVVFNMHKGEKIMHLPNIEAFKFEPGESLILPPSSSMKIDFPTANLFNPSKCYALTIDQQQINKSINYLNQHYPKLSSNDHWSINFNDFHFHNNLEINELLSKIFKLFTDDSTEKDVISRITITELLVRIMQAQNLKSSEKQALANYNPLTFVINYIKANLHEKHTIEDLSRRACLSKASFYRLFKRETGLSPNDYIIREKINKSKSMLVLPNAKITAISYELGFSDSNYFIRMFKKIVGETPGNYIQRCQNEKPMSI